MASRELIQQLLPTCQRCRRLRRKCDTQLPDCRLCQKAGAECTLFDHALQQSLPRAYVQSLLVRLEHLKTVKDTIETSPKREQQQQQQQHQLPAQSSPVTESTHISPSQLPLLQTSPALINGPSPYEYFDKHFPISSSPNQSRFFGSSSVFTLSVEILHHASSKGIITSDFEPAPLPSNPEHLEPEQHLAYDSYAQPDKVRSLVRLFLASSNILYGFVDEQTAGADVQAYFTLRGHGLLPSSLHGAEAHQYFRVSMMCAIACATRARYHPQRTMESLAYYHDALPCVEEVTSEVSPDSLQALLLLTIFCLFYPRKGDIWKLLDYACRLSVELGYHTEQTGDVIEDESQKKLRRSTFWGLYAIERITGQLFGRGSDLPESIITTEYPSVLTVDNDVDQASLQPMSIAHHYRLVYLRSELYKALYLSAYPATYDLAWFKNHCITLRNWRRDLDVSEDLAGVATITCDVGYNSTMCFIFQPLMLRRIKYTEAEGEIKIPICGVPQDNYHSAMALLQTYLKVIRAPENSVLGSYPMTFLSAHYIYLAGLTLMAHALLALDGRLRVFKRMEEMEADSDEDERAFEERMDYSGLWEANNNCILLLQWCAERWPGMEGMRDIYMKLAGRVVPEMMRKGLLSC